MGARNLITTDKEFTDRKARALADLAASLRDHASAANHRLVLVLAGGRGWTLSAAIAALSGQPDSRLMWLSEREVEGPRLPISRGQQLLGFELDDLIYDAHSGFDPDSFGAALGALRGGGLLMLLTPDLESWPRIPDPQAARIAVHPFTSGQIQARFMRRLVRIIAGSTGVTLVSELAPIPRLQRQCHSPADSIPGSTGDCRTLDQQNAVDAIVKTANGRARRPLILTSDRGRGKSSALGIATARLLETGQRSILITAPRRSAVEPLFHHASRLLPDADVQANRIVYRDALLEFLPPDELCRFPRHTDLLLVDEAAGIPAPLLGQLLGEHRRIVFATTVHGYEGTGHGFKVRFRQTLDELTPGWCEARLDTPIRWARNDPLERLVSSALQLDATPTEKSLVDGAWPENCRFRRLDRDALADDEITLCRLFGLLVLAHYQTRPMDLRHLLDGPNVRVYALFYKEQVVATALVAIEGGFGPDLANDVFAGRRRPRGHLLPQTLSAHGGIEEATELSYARVIRIAVHPAARDRGLGKFLLHEIVGDARAQNLDLVGSSFGATGDLLNFWEQCGFSPVHMGTSRNAASGAHAAVVLQPLSPAGESLRALALERFAMRLPSLLTGPLRNLEPAIAGRMLCGAPGGAWTPDRRERRELETFAFALRPYEAALPLLSRLVSDRLGQALRAGILDEKERDTLICKVIQQRGWGEVARWTGLTGKAQVTTMLRKATGKIVQHRVAGGR